MTAPAATSGFGLLSRAQPAAVAALRDAVAAGAVAHAWLLLGPAGSGQDEAARYLGAALNCADDTARAAGTSCGTCPSCVRVLHGTHTAVRDFKPTGTQHRIDDVHDTWLPIATRSTLDGRFKVLRIVAADKMNEKAQNAFLKLLEEPPPSVVWILDAADDARLLDTIISRCRRLDFTPWPQALLRERLDGWVDAGGGDPGIGSGSEATPVAGASSKKAMAIVHRESPGPAERAALVRLAKGSPLRLAELSACDGRRLREAAVTTVGRIIDLGGKQAGGVAPSIVNEVLVAAEQTRARMAESFLEYLLGLGLTLGLTVERKGDKIVVKRPSAWPVGLETAEKKRAEREQKDAVDSAYRGFLELLSTYLQDLLVVASGGGEDAVVNVDRMAALRREAPHIDRVGIVRAMEAMDHGQLAFDLNGQPKLQLERAVVQVVLACAKG